LGNERDNNKLQACQRPRRRTYDDIEIRPACERGQQDCFHDEQNSGPSGSAQNEPSRLYWASVRSDGPAVYPGWEFVQGERCRAVGAVAGHTVSQYACRHNRFDALAEREVRAFTPATPAPANSGESLRRVRRGRAGSGRAYSETAGTRYLCRSHPRTPDLSVLRGSPTN
jgi:hypothetical protein